ncbi:uncharacterized protein LOC119784264 [Cyprinodon tularosa]|uniref:uncharacterized protein LOC119784264 n=1 Tax=Cyprinodon tularosa TaxID=77115 RepID=UPI0018E23D64|nr:uncharacterized protein LOC119784264 [Cyprinodon tularosa]
MAGQHGAVHPPTKPMLPPISSKSSSKEQTSSQPSEFFQAAEVGKSTWCCTSPNQANAATLQLQEFRQGADIADTLEMLKYKLGLRVIVRTIIGPFGLPYHNGVVASTRRPEDLRPNKKTRQPSLLRFWSNPTKGGPGTTTENDHSVDLYERSDIGDTQLKDEQQGPCFDVKTTEEPALNQADLPQTTYDIDISKANDRISEMDDSGKFQLLQTRKPLKSFNFPAREFKDNRRASGVTKRTCQRDWLDKYDFLSFLHHIKMIYRHDQHSGRK